MTVARTPPLSGRRIEGVGVHERLSLVVRRTVMNEYDYESRPTKRRGECDIAHVKRPNSERQQLLKMALRHIDHAL